MFLNDKIAYGQTAVFLGRDFIATVRFGSERDHGTVRRRLEAAADRLIEGPDYVAHAILDFVVDGYQPILEKLEVAVQTIEERAIDAFPEPSTIRRIFRLRRQFRRQPGKVEIAAKPAFRHIDSLGHDLLAQARAQRNQPR